MTIEIVPATYEHAIQLAPFMRDEDSQEVMASGGFTPLEALTISVYVSDVDMKWTALEDGEPIVMWGCAGDSSMDVGVVWLLGSDRIKKIKKRFWQESEAYVEIMQERYSLLYNFVDERNKTSMAWLTKLGFHGAKRVAEYGHHHIPFILFMRRR